MSLISKVSRILCPKFVRRYCGSSSSSIKGVVLGVFEGEDNEPVLSPTAQKFNDKFNGKLTDLLKTSKNEFKMGHGKLFNNIDDEFFAVALVGLGKPDIGYNELEAIHEGMEAARVAAAVGSNLLQSQQVSQIMLEDFGYAEQAAEGAVLALWTYQEYKNERKWTAIPSIDLVEDGDREAFRRGVFKAESQNLARRICDTPANIMTPLRFAQECINELCHCGVRVEVRDRDYIDHQKLTGFSAVARGSCEPPVLIIISYCGGPENQKPILLIGKAITYDSGGLNLKKHCEKLLKYRADLTGAAAILGAIRTAQALSLPANITAILPCCENMPSGMAMKCGDIVVGISGKSIRIADTDNEGRVLLADALQWGQEVYQPRLIIDVGSLTQGHNMALGSGPNGVYTNSQTMWAQTRKAGILTGDRVWRLPLWKYFEKRVTSYASHDVDNRGLGHASSPLAAAFLSQFVTCIDWIHVETTGTGMVAEEKCIPYYKKGRMTGRPTRTISQLLYQLSCPDEGAREFK